jgi:hypothetical protein
MSVDDADLVLDGNALAGLLGEVLAGDPTSAVGTCGACHAAGPLGATVVFVRAPSPVVRCRACGAVLMVVVERRGRVEIRIDRLAAVAF